MHFGLGSFDARPGLLGPLALVVIALAFGLPTSALAEATPQLTCSRIDPTTDPFPEPAIEGAPEWQLRQDLAAQFADDGIPGAAVIAIRGETTVFEMYYGCRSSMPGEQAPVTPDTTFLLASLSKTLTAATVLHLADRLSTLDRDQLDLPPEIEACLGPSPSGPGRSSIDRFMNCPIDTFFPEGFEIDYPCLSEAPAEGCPPPPIRIVELMEHTSGIVDDYHGPLNCTYNLDADSPMSLEQMVERYLDRETSVANPNELLCVNVGTRGWATSKFVAPLYSPDNFGPQGVFRYSNSGYTLLGYMVERVLATVCPHLSPDSPLGSECEASRQPGPGGGATYPMSSYSKHAMLEPMGLGSGGEVVGRWLLSELDDAEACIHRDKGQPLPGAECRIARPAGNLPYYNFPGYPNGGFRATAQGLARFLQMLMNDGRYEGESILTPETAQGIWNFSARPWPWQALTSRGFTVAAIGFALQAAEISEDYNAMLVGHTGGEMGVATSMFWQPVPKVGPAGLTNDPDKSLGVLVITNGDGLDPAIMLSVFEAFQDGSIP